MIDYKKYGIGEREIEFRACEKINKEILFDLDVFAFAGAFGQKARDRFIFMQYTGRRDLNYKKIWEGDILKSGNCYYVVCNGIVEIEDNEMYSSNTVCGFYLRNIIDEYGKPRCIHMDDLEEMEIVGNIFENPELIK